MPTISTTKTSGAVMNGANQNTNISAHGDSIEEAYINPTNPANPRTSQNTNQFTNFSAHGDSIEEANVNPVAPMPRTSIETDTNAPSSCRCTLPPCTTTCNGGRDIHDNACSTDSFSGFSDPGGRFAITNESVHYHHRSGSHLLSDGYSCHGRVEQVKLNENLSKSVSVSVSSIIPPWVHVFAKSTKFTSLRTQAAAIAYIEEPLHKKARHRRNRRAKKKQTSNIDCSLK